MTDAFATLISPLNRLGIHAQEIALVMSLALRFIPTLTDETRAIVDAQSARGGSIETGSLAQRIKAMSAIIVPIFAGTLRHADNLSLALDARCYEEGIRRTHLACPDHRRAKISYSPLPSSSTSRPSSRCRAANSADSTGCYAGVVIRKM